MKAQAGINGFGRTGRCAMRALWEGKNVTIKHINDVNMTVQDMAYLLKYDTTHGRYRGTVAVDGNDLIVNGDRISTSRIAKPDEIPWGEYNVDYVIESTGKFTNYESCSLHLKGGCKKVVVACPAGNDVPMFVCGVNLDMYNSSMNVVSNASCNTNCLALVCKVLEMEFGIVEGLMTTVHAVTNTQQMLDTYSKRDQRRGRSGAFNICPTTTGSAKSVSKVIPSLKGKIDGIALRVPVQNGCNIDLTVTLARSTSYQEIVDAIKKHSESGPMKGYLGYIEDDFVSSDIIGDNRSSIFDVKSGIALSDRFFKLIAWTDNEYAYSARLLDLVAFMHSVDNK
jgi:glyceraldehyde 3-phosphate dehydrogenase